MKGTEALEDSFYPDPRQFGLTEDFIYVEKEWGSLFYKHLGKLKKTEAKQVCSQYGDSGGFSNTFRVNGAPRQYEND